MLLQWLEFWSNNTDGLLHSELIQKITFRASLASITAFLVTLLLGPIAIRILRHYCPERISSHSPHLQKISQSKQSTPTMGGLFMLIAIAFALILCGQLLNRFVQLAAFLVTGLGIIGAVDDWIKLQGHRNGLSIRNKLFAELLIIVPVAFFLYQHLSSIHGSLPLVIPFVSKVYDLGILFLPLSIIVLLASCNAVNLTDGLDGLAGGCLIFSGAGLGAITYFAGHHELANYLSIPYFPGAGELSILLSAMVGAVLGFLWFNCYPAQVFMGDTGSLPLGGLLGMVAVATRQEILLVILGGVFVIETASVVIQVCCYRWKKRRIFLCAPLHHHFQFKGWHETKIVVRFWIAAALLAILSVASLKIR